MDSASAATAYLERGEPTKGDWLSTKQASGGPSQGSRVSVAQAHRADRAAPHPLERSSKGGSQGDQGGGLHLPAEVLTPSRGGRALPWVACPSQRMFLREKENRSEVRAVPRGCDQSDFPRKCALHTETWKQMQLIHNPGFRAPETGPES